MHDLRHPQRGAGIAGQVIEDSDLRSEILRQFVGVGDLQDEAATRRLQPEVLVDGTGQFVGYRGEPPVTPRQFLRLVCGQSGNDRASPLRVRNLPSLPPSGGSGKLRRFRGRVNLGAPRLQHRRLS